MFGFWLLQGQRDRCPDEFESSALGWSGFGEGGHVLGLAAGDAEMLNDDRVRRTLDKLFDADRASLITATVLAVIADFDVAGRHPALPRTA